MVIDSNEEVFNTENEGLSDRSLEWDLHESNTTLEDPLNDCLLYNSPRMVPLYRHGQDLDQVFDFSKVLPIQSSPKAVNHTRSKSKVKGKVKTLGNIFKRKTRNGKK